MTEGSGQKEKKLGEILLDKGIINPKDLDEALEEQKRTKEFLGTILKKRGKIREKQLLEALSEQFGMPCISLKYKYIDWSLVKNFSSSLILDNRCFPVSREKNTVTVAVTIPIDVWVLKKAEDEARSQGMEAKPALVSEEDMRDILERYREYLRGTI